MFQKKQQAVAFQNIFAIIKVVLPFECERGGDKELVLCASFTRYPQAACEAHALASSLAIAH